jgi:hypothetical protein
MRTEQIQPEAARLLTNAAMRHKAEVERLTDHGYGAYLYGILSREAWVCAQKGCEIAWPAEKLKAVPTWKRREDGPNVLPNPSVPAHMVRPEVVALFNANRRQNPE